MLLKQRRKKWNVIGGFMTNYERDIFGIDLCTHFLAIDFNTDEKEKAEH